MNTGLLPYITLTLLLSTTLSLRAEPKVLTPASLAALSLPTNARPGEMISVEISGFNKVVLPISRQAELKSVREFRFPSKFTPAHSTKDPKYKDGFVPTFPADFGMIEAGWTLRLSTRQTGGVIELMGVADFIDAELVNGGYGALAGPIHNEEGKLLSPNVLKQPLQQTTTTRFHLFAVPGETYEVLLYKGKKPERHTVKVMRQ